MLKIFLLAGLAVNVLVDSTPLYKPAIEGRIVGGNSTDITRTPYQAAVYLEWFYMCGGIILSPIHILTSSYCVAVSSEVTLVVRAGSSSLSTGFKVGKVKKAYPHPKFNVTTMDYDVTILEMVNPFKLDNKTMKAIKLATKEPSPGSVAVASGWGFDMVSDDFAKTLQSISIPVVDRKTCEAAYKAKNMTITPRMMCAGVKGKYVFMGDEGGPIAYKDELVGIISFGWSFGTDLPGVFTNIANPEITKFIKDIVKY